MGKGHPKGDAGSSASGLGTCKLHLGVRTVGEGVSDMGPHLCMAHLPSCGFSVQWWTDIISTHIRHPGLVGRTQMTQCRKVKCTKPWTQETHQVGVNITRENLTREICPRTISKNVAHEFLPDDYFSRSKSPGPHPRDTEAGSTRTRFSHAQR